MNSINHPWGITEKFKQRYGETWSEMDFIVSKINNYHFKNDPLNIKVGTLHVCNKSILMTFKQLIAYNTTVSDLLKGVYFERTPKDVTIPINVNNTMLYLKKHELGRLAETLSDSIGCIEKSYQLGLYL